MKIAANQEIAQSTPEPERRPRAAAPAAAHHSPLELYKPGRGVFVRWGTAVGASILLLAGASFIYDQLGRFEFGEQVLWRYLIPLLVVLAAGIGIFHVCGRHRKLVDFFIATEDEMRKVNWSTRREVFGSTRIVIVVLLGMGFMLFLIDILFMFFFGLIGVLRVANVSQLLSSGSPAQ